jgi:hypothetical protein
VVIGRIRMSRAAFGIDRETARDYDCALLNANGRMSRLAVPQPLRTL